MYMYVKDLNKMNWLKTTVSLFLNCRHISFHCSRGASRDALVSRLVSINFSREWSPLFVSDLRSAIACRLTNLYACVEG